LTPIKDQPAGDAAGVRDEVIASLPFRLRDNLWAAGPSGRL